MPADIIQVHSLYPSSLEDQSIVFDTDDPTRTISHGNADILAPSHTTKRIPISALSSRYTDDRELRGQIDTGAGISCSNALHLFHNYRQYNESFKSNIQLSAAIRKGNSDVNASVIPEGEGYLLIPAINTNGYIAVRAVYSPHLTSTLIGENCLMGSTKAQQDEYEYQGIQKFFDLNLFLLVFDCRLDSTGCCR